MKKNTPILTVILLMSCLLNFQTLHAQGTKDVYVSVNTLLNSIPGYAKDVQSLDSLKKAYEKDIQTKDQSIKIRVNNLLKPYNPKENETVDIMRARMSTVDTIQLNLLVNESELLENTLKSYQNLLALEENETTKKVQAMVDEVLTAYAKKMKIHTIKNLDNINNLLFLDGELNHTDKILAEIMKKVNSPQMVARGSQ